MRSLALLLAALVLAACAGRDAARDGRWQKPNTSESQLAADEAACRDRASREVEREVRRDEALRDAPAATAGSFDAAMTRYDARRRIARLVANCMRARGYGLAPSD